MHILVYVCMHVDIMCSHVFVHACVCACVHYVIYVCLHACVCVCVRVLCVCVQVQVQVHKCIIQQANGHQSEMARRGRELVARTPTVSQRYTKCLDSS